MTPTAIAAVEVRPVRWPLRRPFVTALGRKTHSENVLVAVRLTGGLVGRGEASSSLAMPFQTGHRMASALRRLAPWSRGRDVRDIRSLSLALWRREGAWPTAAAAFEAALWDALAQSEGVPLYALWGKKQTEIETVLSVSAVDPAEVGRRAARAGRAGYRKIKLKLNGAEGAAINIERVRRAFQGAPRARFLLDPNQSLTPVLLEEILAGARRDGVPLAAVEEPFPKHRWDLLEEARPPCPLILDESIQSARDARIAYRRDGVSGANIKLAKSGVLRSFDIVDETRAARGRRARLMIGCMAESRLGLAAAVHFALGTGVFDEADLDSDLILRPTPFRGGYVRRGPWIRLPRRPEPGLGVR
ncbi:MAG TPA: enolase C-terminal domain-like protein [Elusimicrobiota bacterium]|nr:enolase C-terminal domain-like protein [Elusimicrobiota bacterium]HND64870.1 enolase C-terminal domain-like protein [Elusimicrobiota bacterium]